MEYIAYFLKNNTNYVNKSNLFNFFISILKFRNEDEIRTFFDIMKIHMGLTFYTEFRNYIFRKIPKSKILAFMD